MDKISGINILNAIGGLSRNKDYNYINPKNRGLIRIMEVVPQTGPIYFKRYNPIKQETLHNAKIETISKEMIWRAANAISKGEPFNLDRIYAGSYNTRSVFETLLALTPQFYHCMPGRIFDINGQTSIERGHKHLIWCPDEPHANEQLVEKVVKDMEISELPYKQVVYDSLELPDYLIDKNIDINIQRRHLQIQIALYLIGLHLGFRTWIAQNDKGVRYKDQPLYKQEGVIPVLSDDSNVLSFMPGAVESAKLIDCIWFQNHRYVPAVMEVEHTTGVTSGLARMQGLYHTMPSVMTRYVIVAPDDLRDKVVHEINRQQFQELDARYLPYSSVEELYYLCVNRKVKGISQDFLDNFMEPVCDIHKNSVLYQVHMDGGTFVQNQTINQK